MQANSILPIPLPDGIYCGTWKESYVTVSIKGEETTFKVDKGVWRRKFPCIVIIYNKQAIIDSGNPLVCSNWMVNMHSNESLVIKNNL